MKFTQSCFTTFYKFHLFFLFSAQEFESEIHKLIDDDMEDKIEMICVDSSMKIPKRKILTYKKYDDNDLKKYLKEEGSTGKKSKDSKAASPRVKSK